MSCAPLMMVPISHSLHAEIPALAVAEVHDLLGDHPKVLTRDTRRGAVCLAAAICTVTRDALGKELRAVDLIRLCLQNAGVFAARASRGRSEDRQQQRDKRHSVDKNFHGSALRDFHGELATRMRSAAPRASTRLSTFNGTQVWADTREVVGHTTQCFRRNASQHLDVRAIHSRTIVGRRFLQLA